MKKILSSILIAFMLLSGTNAFAATDGLKTIYIFVKDRAGNVQTTAKTASITLDTANPSIVFSTNPDNTQTQTKTVRATVTDTNLDTIQYVQIPSATACNGALTFTDSYTSGSGIILSSEADNGTKICIKAKDKANNYTHLASNVIENIDRTAPTIWITYKNATDQIISDTDATTTRKVWGTISDPTTGSSNFGTPTLYISTTLAPGTYTSSGECAWASYSTYSTERVFSNPVADNNKQLCFKWVDPAGNISYNLVTVHMNAIPLFTSVSKNDTHINQENQSAVSFTVNGIMDNDNDPVTIKYSWDGTNYTTLTTVNNTSTAANYGPFTLDTTSLPQWSNTLTVKLNDGNYDSTTHTVSIFKDSILPTIGVHNQANTNPEQVKYLSGVIADTNNYASYIVIVPAASSCSTQTYSTPYTTGQDIVLNDEVYNGKKVCFKATDEYGNTQYAESSVISGIDRTAPVTPTDVIINTWDLFTNNANINLDITHPNESDVEEWCISETNDYNSCIWTTTKPSTYQIQN